MIGSEQISARVVIEACTGASERIRTIITEKTYRRPLSDEEVANRESYLAAIGAFAEEVESLGDGRPSIARIARAVSSLAPYPGGLLLEELLAKCNKRQRLSLCRNILSHPVKDRRDKVVFACLDELGKLATSEALAVLGTCVKTGVLAPAAGGVLMRALAFPPVGEAAELLAELGQDFSREKANEFLRMLGVDPADFKYVPEKAGAFRGEAHSDLSAILANPEKVIAIDLSGKRIRDFPDELQRCANVRYLNIDDDYFSSDEMKRIEALFPSVRVKWTRGLYVDGKHGR